MGSWKDNFFNDEEGYKYPYGEDIMQAIPITFESLSKLSDAELQMIYQDLS